jgi:hypothetical protein
MLLRHIKVLGGAASPKVGGLYGKAMAIETIEERVALLNLGRGGVARRLREMLPRVRDDGLHAISPICCGHTTSTPPSPMRPQVDLASGLATTQSIRSAVGTRTRCRRALEWRRRPGCQLG